MNLPGGGSKKLHLGQDSTLRDLSNASSHLFSEPKGQELFFNSESRIAKLHKRVSRAHVAPKIGEMALVKEHRESFPTSYCIPGFECIYIEVLIGHLCFLL